jgi:hypothetical protein
MVATASSSRPHACIKNPRKEVIDARERPEVLVCNTAKLNDQNISRNNLRRSYIDLDTIITQQTSLVLRSSHQRPLVIQSRPLLCSQESGCFDLTPYLNSDMFQQIIGSVHRAELLPLWHQVNLSRSFTVSLSRSQKTWALLSPEERRRLYNYYGEKYKTDAKYRAHIIERNTANTAARRALLSEEENRQRTLLESFRSFVKRRMKEGRLPDWDTHFPEVVDESVVHNCVSCGRVHYKGRTKIWWRSKQNEEYEVSTRGSTYHS